jgi:hypothetical protein
MRGLLRSQNPSLAESDEQLDRHLAGILVAARRFGVFSRHDERRLLETAAVLGWDFLEDPACGWAAAFLADPAVSSPSGRVDRLVEQVARRRQVQERNRALAAAFAGQP